VPGWDTNALILPSTILLVCIHWHFCFVDILTGLAGTNSIILQEEMMRGKSGYEHLNEPLHILVEAELPAEIIDARLMQAREILEDLLKPVVYGINIFILQNFLITLL
jgi:hypothetical protein